LIIRREVRAGMSRRAKVEEEHVNHERWLVSYADFVTLLFAFFVVMYAVSSVNEGKYRVLSDALTSAFGKVPDRHRVAGPVDPVPQYIAPRAQNRKKAKLFAETAKERDRLAVLTQSMLTALSPLVSQGKVTVTWSARGVSLELNANALFKQGKATLEPDAVAALSALVPVLRDDPHAVEVAGHTDDVPISSVEFPSNWELSAARAASVIRLLADGGLPPGRFTAVGHGANLPVETNETPEGRARNRRVDITILSSLPLLDPTDGPARAAAETPAHPAGEVVVPGQWAGSSR
jgi:chemotaxis protein MotB